MSGAGATRFLRLAASLAIVLGAVPLQAQPQIPDRRPLVMDSAGIISAETEKLLTDALVGFRQTQRREISIVTVPDLQGYGIDQYARQLRLASGLDDGDADGAVLLVAPNDMEVRIEAGSAVKSILTEDVARDIVETAILPSFRQGDMDQGVLNGTGTIFNHLELPPEEAAAIAEEARLAAAELQESEGFPWGGLAVLVLLAIAWSILRRGGLFGFAAGAITLLGSGGGGAGGSDGRFGGFGGGGSGFNGGGAGGRW